MTGAVVPIRPAMIAKVMKDARAAFDPARRGYSISYRVGQTQVPPCPGCGRTNWLVGRQSAECAFCHTALPLT